MKSVADAPELRLTRLQKLIEFFKAPPSMVISNLFGSDEAPSDTIEWQSETGDRGITPIAGENVEAPRTSPTGMADHSAKAAFWKEKIYLAAKFLNNICDPTDKKKYMSAKKYLAKQMMRLKYRCMRRAEWFYAKMFNTGSIGYKDPEGNAIALDYGIPSGNQVTLGAKDKWNYNESDSTKNILEDIMTAQETASNLFSGKYTHSFFTTEVLKMMVLDPGVRDLMKKSSFGDGKLFTHPTQSLSMLLGIDNMIIYDESYRIPSWLTSAVAAGAGPHTISGDNFTDFEVGMTLTMVNASLQKNNTETLTITAVDVLAGTVTATGTLARAYVAGRDFCYVAKKFIDPNKFILFSPTVEGQAIAEMMLAPFSLQRTWGLTVDTHEKWDPDGLFVRVQNKGLPVLYFPDAIYQLTVA